MAVSYQHLRAFHAIAAERGVSRAARRLNVSQPTLSQQLKALEARHGVALFEGRRSPLTLTAAGCELFVLTQRLFGTASDIDELLGPTTGLSGGLLRLGSASPRHAARVVACFHRHHPTTAVQIRTGDTADVLHWLGAAQIDAALAIDPPADAAFSYDLLYTDHLACALPAGHALADREAVPVTALAGAVLLQREAGSPSRAVVERALAEAGIAPVATIECHDRETIREAVALGLGLGLFFAAECPPDARLAYRPLELATGAAGTHEVHGFLLGQAERRRSGLMRALKAVVVELRSPDGGGRSA